MQSGEFTLRSGRVIGVTESGAQDAPNTVVFFHPTPGASVFDPDPEITAATGVRLIGIDRPGYGVSEPMPEGEWATVGRAAADAAEYLFAHHHKQVGVVGWSAGGRVALALAAAKPHLVSRVAVLGTPAPEAEVSWQGGEVNAMAASLAGASPSTAKEAIAAQFSAMAGDELSSELLLGLLGVSEADAEVLEAPGVRERVIGMLESSVAQGFQGLASDLAGISLVDWGFDPFDVHAPTLLLYGSDDVVAASAHASWYRDNLMRPRMEIMAGAGHLAIVPGWRRVLQFVTG